MTTQRTRRIASTYARRRAVAIAWALVTSTAAYAQGQTQTQTQAQAQPPTFDVGAENRRCLECHGQPHIAELSALDRLAMVGAPPGTEVTSDQPRPALHLGPDAFAGSVHADLACIQCHADASELPHAVQLEPVACGTCHDVARAAFDRGAHAGALARHDPDAPNCADCHGAHDVLPPEDRKSLTHPLNVIATCGECHRDHSADGSSGANVDAYLDSVHGRAVLSGGLIVAATCAECHGHHDVRGTTDPEALTSRANVSQTCGQCHLGVVEVYADSVHGLLSQDGDDRAPVCTDCHTTHRITHASMPDEHYVDIVSECGECHDENGHGRTSSFYDTYRASYHGQVTALGSNLAAHCSDCHGAHDVHSVDDPTSRLFGTNRIATCRTCHEGAGAKFAEFDPHADYHDRDRYPLLHAVWLYFIIVMSAAFGFFGLHSVLWFVRSAVAHVRHGPHPRHVATTHGIRRFTRLNRVNHALVIITFFGLTITGIPLLFSDARWAQALASVLGGPAAAGLWHRSFAILLLANFAIHIVGLVRSAKQRYGVGFWRWLFGPDSLMPRFKDVRDCTGMFRWFFGAKRKPSFGRWTYWEKFDYWAEIAGTLIIGGSGLLLWFPAFFSRLLPGVVFNVAMIIHGYEALLALGFIFTIHFFNAHLRLEKFPVDDVIFSGQLPEEEFREERGEQYERLVASGEIERLREPPAPAYIRHVALVVGIIAMAIGLTLVTLIILAGLDVL